MIKAIGFDVGGVIFPDLHLPVQGKIAQKLGISPETALKIYEEIWPRLCIGQTTEDELWRKLIEKSERDASGEELARVFRSELVPDPQIISLIKNLSARYHLFIVSNTAKEWLDYELDTFRLSLFFKTVVSSVEAKARKPDPAFFEFLLRQLPFSPKNCVFVDDREKNTQTAAKFGFRPIIFRDFSSFVKEFSREGIVFGEQRGKECR